MAQQYLGTLGTQLASLKRDISAQLGSPVPDDRLAAGIADFQALWQQRLPATQGSLDKQLQFRPDGNSQQTFQIKGLDSHSLQRSDKETLAFTVGSGTAGGRVLTAVLEADQPARARLRALDQTLAVADIRVGVNAAGEPILSTPESNWSAVRDNLGIRGGGVRFPAKQFHRVRLEATPAAITPESWRVSDSVALRQTLHDVVQAQRLVQRSQGEVDQAIGRLATTMDAERPAMSAARAQAFAHDFQRIGQQPSGALIGAIGPAVLGISRERVDRLLALADLPAAKIGA